MGEKLQAVISSRAMTVLGLKPFNDNSKSCSKENYICNEATDGVDSLEAFKDRADRIRSPNEDLKWKSLACFLDRLFFVIHVIVLAIVVSISEGV